MSESFKYNLLNILRPIKFLPWFIVAFAIFNAIFPTKFGYINYGKIDHNSIKKIEYRAKNVQTGASKTVVSYSFTYKTKSGELKYVVPMGLKDWNWCDNHTHDFNDYTYFKEDGPGKKKAIIEKLKTDSHYIKKPTALCNAMLCLWGLLLLMLQCLFCVSLSDDDGLYSLFFPLPCEEYNKVDSRKLRLKLNALFLGYKLNDIDNFMMWLIEKRNKLYLDQYYFYEEYCNLKTFKEWLNSKDIK